MKKKINIKTAILSLMGGLVLLSSSCLKDNSHYVNYLADAPLAEFPLAEVNDNYQPGGSDGAYQAVSVPASSGTFSLTVAVKVAAPKALTSNTTFTISTTDVTELNALNTAGAEEGAVMQALPSSAFSIVGGNQVVVKAGTTTTYFTIKIDESALDPSGTYALPLTITNAGGIQIAGPEQYLVYDFFTPGG